MEGRGGREGKERTYLPFRDPVGKCRYTVTKQYCPYPGPVEAMSELFVGFGYRMMWAAGAVAAMSSITFPAVSALVSRTADADQQGELIGISDNYLNPGCSHPLFSLLRWIR